MYLLVHEQFVYTWATTSLTLCRVGTNRFSFLLESLADLNEGFKARGSRLMIVHGNPPEVVPKLIKVCTVLCRGKQQALNGMLDTADCMEKHSTKSKRLQRFGPAAVAERQISASFGRQKDLGP